MAEGQWTRLGKMEQEAHLLLRLSLAVVENLPETDDSRLQASLALDGLRPGIGQSQNFIIQVLALKLQHLALTVNPGTAMMRVGLLGREY